MQTTTTRNRKQADSRPLAQHTDEQLLIDYRQTGDSNSFTELVRRYERELYNHVRSYVHDAAMAEDVFQSTFLQLHVNVDKYQPGLKLRPWLYRIATNQAIDALRRNRRHRLASLDAETDEATLAGAIPGEVPAPSARIEQKERNKSLRGAVNRLPEHLRTIVTLVYFKGMKYREAADELSIPLGTLKSRMHTALTMLKDFIPATHPATV